MVFPPTPRPISTVNKDSKPPLVALDSALLKLPSALYEKLSLLLHKDEAWRKVLQTEDKVTREMEIDASNYYEGIERKPAKKAMDILSGLGWTVGKLMDSLHHLGHTEAGDILKRIIDFQSIQRKKEIESDEDSKVVPDFQNMQRKKEIESDEDSKVVPDFQNMQRKKEIESDEDNEVVPGDREIPQINLGIPDVSLRIHRYQFMGSQDAEDGTSITYSLSGEMVGKSIASQGISSIHPTDLEDCVENICNDHEFPCPSILGSEGNTHYNHALREAAFPSVTSPQSTGTEGSLSSPQSTGSEENPHYDHALPNFACLTLSSPQSRDENASTEMPMESHLLEEAVDYDHDQAGDSNMVIRQASGVGTCKLLLPMGSMPMPMTQDSSARPSKSLSED